MCRAISWRSYFNQLGNRVNYYRQIFLEMSQGNGSGKRKLSELVQNCEQSLNVSNKKAHIKQVLTYDGLLLVAQFADSCKIQSSETRNDENSIQDGDNSGDSFSVLTYNIWFEDIEMAARIDSIIRIITDEAYPDVIMLQEVIARSYKMLFENVLLRYLYHFSEPQNYSYFTAMLVKKKTVRGQCANIGTMDYTNSLMGRGVMFCSLDLNGRRICIGTTHLESVFGHPYANKKIKGEQFQKAVECLRDESPNILLCGDFNWNDDKEGNLESEGLQVQDVWTQLYPQLPGYTYDGRINQMISRFQNRLDRMYYQIQDVEASECKLIGKDPIPNLSTVKKLQNRSFEVPVYPSDHFGLLAKFKSKKKVVQEGSLQEEE
eukprot:TRINITY_DN15878_c0_g1_i2.p1 TRINITY_DN15878_c0_g1~~TRINITY_DN15878_c0_g1_i2.p1  ORF type:complete len:376 (-),score=35.65 TRINITY_DN15878_c0_g1_i2:238-1365(-)